MYLGCRVADNAQERRRVAYPLLDVERLSVTTGILADVIRDVIHGVPTDVSDDIIAGIPADVINDVIAGILGDVIRDVIAGVLADVIVNVIVKHRSYAGVDVRRVAGGRYRETAVGV